MPPKSKSTFRQPGAKHFQLVHRSQRDPLINDPEASQHVLKAFVRENDKKGKTRADLEDLLGNEVQSDPKLARLGQASLYGIYYDDSEYDYMQHLRTVGMQEEGVESILMEVPSTSKGTQRSKKKSGIDIPDEALPSTYELPRTYETQQAVPESIAGFQPDMDPHLRQTLEALEDDAFVDDGLEDDFFAELVGEGERYSDEELEYEFNEDGVPSDEEAKGSDQNEDDMSWEDRFKQFKKDQAAAKKDRDSDDDFASEGGDTVGTLQTMSVIGGKKRRRKGGSDATGYSMSSSSMFRHDGLKTLDDRFDQMMLKEYENEGEGEEEDGDHSDEDSDEAPELITSREDFEGMVDEFLNDYEILGRRMRPKLEGETGAEKLGTFRQAIGIDERVRIQQGDDDSEPEGFELIEEDKKDRWDCETILSTYSNLENHPRMIRARTSKPVPKISIDPSTGLPTTEANERPANKRAANRRQPLYNSEDTDSEGDSDATEKGHRGPAVGRNRKETPEEKKARKQGAKQQKQARRVEKKATKEQFSAEIKSLKKMLPATEIKMKKL